MKEYIFTCQADIDIGSYSQLVLGNLYQVLSYDTKTDMYTIRGRFRSVLSERIDIKYRKYNIPSEKMERAYWGEKKP